MNDALMIRNVSDTASWVAMYRARETDRDNALFRDPFARLLAGERGEQIVAAMKQERNEWAFVIRTFLFDAFITQEIANGADTVLNLAAGLDARPYRLPLSPTLQWIEVDLPELIAWKEDILRDETPRCRLERVALDLADAAARRELFARVGATAKKVLIITEGLLIYLEPADVRTFAEDLAAPPSFQRWVLDIASPGLLKMMMKQVGKELTRASSPLKFAPEEGPEFFAASGWRALDVRSSFKTAAQQGRLPLLLRFFALFPEPPRPGNRPWAATCLLGK